MWLELFESHSHECVDCNVTANMVKIDRKMANSPLNATPLHPHCNLVAPPLKTA